MGNWIEIARDVEMHPGGLERCKHCQILWRELAGCANKEEQDDKIGENLDDFFTFFPH